MKIVNIAQGDEDWHQWRINGITASEIAVILGISPYKTPWQLWAEKTGLIEPVNLDGNPNVRKGKKNEDRLRQFIEQRDGKILLPFCAESDENPIFRASYDGVDADQIPHELKWPSEPVWQEILSAGENSEAYQLYAPQVMHQIMVAGSECSHGYLIFGHEGEDGIEMIEFKINRDDTFIKKIIKEGEEFYHLVATREEPEKRKDSDPYIPSEELKRKRWQNLANKARQLQTSEKQLKTALTTVTEELKAIRMEALEMQGDFSKSDYYGLAVTRFVKGGAIDYKKLIESRLPDISEDELNSFRKPDKTETRMTIKDIPKNEPEIKPDAVTVSSSGGDWF